MKFISFSFMRILYYRTKYPFMHLVGANLRCLLDQLLTVHMIHNVEYTNIC